MGKVIAEQSVSFDGFSAGPNVRVGNGMGDGGEALHEWLSREAERTGRGGKVYEDAFDGTGAVAVGRRMLDVGEEPWGDDPPFHCPVFIVTHRPKAPVVKRGGTTYTFVTDGHEATLALARAAAGDEDVIALGGADVIGQCLAGGHLDELQLHLAPPPARRRDPLLRRPRRGERGIRADARDRRRGRHPHPLPRRQIGPARMRTTWAGPWLWVERRPAGAAL